MDLHRESLWIKEGAKSGSWYNVKVIHRQCFCQFFFQLILAPLLLCSFIPLTSLLLLAEVFGAYVNGADVLWLQTYSGCRWTFVTAAMSQDVLQCYSMLPQKITALWAEKNPILKLVVRHGSNQFGADVAAVLSMSNLNFLLGFDKDSGCCWLG